MAVALVFLLKSMNKQFRKIAPKEEAAVRRRRRTKTAPGEPPAQETPK